MTRNSQATGHCHSFPLLRNFSCSAQLGVTLPSSGATFPPSRASAVAGGEQPVSREQWQQELDEADTSAVFGALLPVPELLEQVGVGVTTV